MSTPEYRVKVLEAEVDLAKEYLESLRSEDLQKLSACENWTVADVVAHMVGQDFALRVTRGLQGDISPPEGAPAVADHDEDRFAQNISDRAKSTNERHGGQLVEVFSRRSLLLIPLTGTSSATGLRGRNRCGPCWICALPN
jgi:hypothetical protein